MSSIPNAPATRQPTGSPVTNRIAGAACCTVCGSSDGRFIDYKAAYELMQCRCGAMYLSPPVPEGAVDHTLDTHPRSFYERPIAMKLRWLQRSHPRGRLLEVGFGEGLFLQAARDRGYDVCGIELDAQRAQRVHQRLGIQVACEDIEHTSWPEASCDIVYHCDLLSHFPQPALALRRMATLLRPGGVLYFEVGILGGLPDHWYRAISPRSVPRHRWFFSHSSLERLLEQEGLRIERMKTFGLGPQVLTQQALTHLRKLVRPLVSPRTPTSSVNPHSPVPGEQIRERLGAFHNFMRFGVGAMFPTTGPLTALVLASRHPG